MNTFRVSKDECLAIYGGRKLFFKRYTRRPYEPSSCAQCACASAPEPCLPCSRSTRKDRTGGYWKEQT